MMEKATKQEQIELYLTGALSGEDLANFEKMLQEDKAFAEDVEIMKDIEAAFQDARLEKAITPKLEELGKKYMPDASSTNATPSPFNPWIIGAVIITLGLAGGAWAWINNAKDEPVQEEVQEPMENIFASHMDAYTSNTITRGEEDNNWSEDYKNALDLYENGAYDDAIPVLKNHLSANENDVEAKILLGNCYLKTTPIQLNKAIQTFKEIVNGEPTVFTQAAQWYLALAYFENAQEADAKATLEKLASKRGKYAEKAKGLLNGYKMSN